jgi:diguanylate cyclase (GGDEF)-like protein
MNRRDDSQPGVDRSLEDLSAASTRANEPDIAAMDLRQMRLEFRTVLAERDALHEELLTLRKQQPLLAALGSILEAIVIYDADGRLVVCNDNFRTLYGYTEEEASPGVHYSELGRIDIERGNVAVGDEFGDGEEYLARKAEYRQRLEGSFIVQLKDGRWIKTIDRPVRGGGFASIQIDITEVKALEEQMRYMAQHDSLTSLPNRRLFIDHGRVLLATAERRQTSIALLFLDIDHFKEINDTFGHLVGDELLRQIAQRLKARLRASDLLARLSGDEFVVLLQLQDAYTARHVADILIREIGREFLIKDQRVSVSTSIGIAYYPADGTNLDELLDRSDHALYGAKGSGKGRWVEFSG